ncbi:unnamed protein product, partial [Ectocarpus sp. 13 AM-2016]
ASCALQRHGIFCESEGMHGTGRQRPLVPGHLAEGIPRAVPEPLVRSKRLPLYGDRRQGGRAIEARICLHDERNRSWRRSLHHVPQAVHHQPRSGRREVHVRRAGVSPEDVSALGRFRGGREEGGGLSCDVHVGLDHFCLWCRLRG